MQLRATAPRHITAKTFHGFDRFYLSFDLLLFSNIDNLRRSYRYSQPMKTSQVTPVAALN